MGHRHRGSGFVCSISTVAVRGQRNPDHRPAPLTSRLQELPITSGVPPRAGDVPTRWSSPAGPTGAHRRIEGAPRAMNKTTLPSLATLDRQWYVVDAADQTLGRLASEVAHLMDTTRINHLLVVDAQGQLLGAVGVHDLLESKIL